MTATPTGRPHGYARYKLDGCRCYTCAYAVSQYELNRVRGITAGTWQPFVDADPARRHLRALSTAGVGRRRVAELTGLTETCLTRLTSGGPNGRPPTRRIRPDTERKILAIASVDVAAGVIIDSTGTVRRLRALHALGWTFTALAAEIGWTVQNLSTMLGAARVTRNTADLVTALYDRLSMTTAPDTPSASRSRRAAARNGWFTPLAWDDDAIDDPAAVPSLLPPVDGSDPDADEMAIQHRMAGHTVTLARVDEVEMVRRLHAAGWTGKQIGDVIGRDRDYATRIARNLGAGRG